ncbi:hypothetical protein HO133_007945 [Letharia lupina]|uniref:Uncharacterized protein n=1 Tax=Letharia lupina TaxID=560253 RepID=A0A8H6FH91_9LECA|nr:uncharacterized protein HO133_007945 [Letharia lupina]KAF6228215.1 hypothetical protein HO133_007945 [Letharia lupina]
MWVRRSFPTKHSHDGINTLRRKRRTASHGTRIARALSRFRSFAASTVIKATGSSGRDEDEDGIDWGSEENLGEGRRTETTDGAVCATPTGISTVNGVAARKAMRRTSSE